MADDVIEFYVTPGHAGDPTFNLRVSPEIADEVLSSLDDHGLRHSQILEFSTGAPLWVEAVVVLAGAGGAAAAFKQLVAVIQTIVKRHEGKRFVFERGGEKFDVSGVSEKTMMRLLEKTLEQKVELDRETQGVLGERSRGAGGEADPNPIE